MAKVIMFISILVLVFTNSVSGQKNKKKKDKLADGRPTPTMVYGDSLRTDSIVYYETVVGYIMPDHSKKFKGKWNIQVMRRQAMAVPDTLSDAYFDFDGDTSFTAKVGCSRFAGTYIIKGPTIKFIIKDTSTVECLGEIEDWFIKLIEERVSYFGIDESILYLKDVAFNIVFDCARIRETGDTSSR